MGLPRHVLAGFALLEVMVAIGVLMVFAAGVAPLFSTTDAALGGARHQGMTSVVAAAKLQQLQGLVWGYALDSAGNLVPVADETTDLSTEPPGVGGPGLRIGPHETLWNDTPGYVDFLDEAGRWVGSGPRAPIDAVYVRRWAVTTLGGSSGSALVLEAMAATLRADRSSPRVGRSHRPGDTWLVTVKVRLRP